MMTVTDLKLNIHVTVMESIVCSICYEEITSDSETILECQHRFHNICIKAWINKKIQHEATCPYCRRNIELQPSTSQNAKEEKPNVEISVTTTDTNYIVKVDDNLLHTFSIPHTLYHRISQRERYILLTCMNTLSDVYTEVDICREAVYRILEITSKPYKFW
jgi:hypothetical protein